MNYKLISNFQDIFKRKYNDNKKTQKYREKKVL